ncbi:MAG: flippase [Caldilineaceae bacterium]
MTIQTTSVTPNMTAATSVTTSDIRVFAKGGIISLAGKFIGRGTNSLLQIFLARALGPQALGLYALGWTTIRLGGVLIPLGLDRGIIHFTSNDWQENPGRFRSILQRSLAAGFISGCLTGILLFVAAPQLAAFMQKPELVNVLRGFAFAYPLLAGMKIMAAATTVSKRMQYAVYIEDFGFPFFNLMLFLILFGFGMKLTGAIIATICSLLIVCALGFYFLKQILADLPLATVVPSMTLPMGTLLAYSVPSAFAGVFNVLLLWLDRYFIGYYLSAEQTGIYQALTQIPILFVISLQGLNAIFSPMIASIYAQKEHTRLNELFKISTKWGIYCSLPLFIVAVLFPDHLLYVMFGSRYMGWTVPLIILATGQMLNAITGPVGYMLIMTGHQKYWFWLCMIALIINSVLNSWLVPLYGFSGAAIATAISVVTLNGGALLQTRRVLQLWPYDWRYLKGVIAAATTTVSVLFYAHFAIGWPLVVQLFGALALVGVMFYGLLFLLWI